MRTLRYTLIATMLSAAVGGSFCPVAAQMQSDPLQSVIRRLPPVNDLPTVDARTAKAREVVTETTAANPLVLPPQPIVEAVASTKPSLEEPAEFVEQKKTASRFAGIHDFHQSMEADVHEDTVDTESEIDPQSLLKIQLPAEVVARTQSMLKDATTLANRGAHYAAREQFEKIMRVTCQALDAQVGRPVHTRGLARGLRAIEEAEDFGLNGDSPESDLHLGGFIAGHSTPVLKDVPSSEITAILAMQAYYRYAVEQLSIAGNNEPISGKALFSLGRIESILSSKNGQLAGGGPKALAFYHASLAVNPTNGRAANELGVMLARRGRWQDARNVLHEAARSEPTALINLSKVYGRLGDNRRSQQFAQQARMVASRNPAAFQRGPASGVRWVDNTTFVNDGAGNDVMPSSGKIRRASTAISAGTSGASQADYQPAATPAKNKKTRNPFVWGR